MAIYVEIPIRCSMEELWEKTQNPKLHQRWDLRFSEIEYLPREGEQPQRFLYRTRIGFGVKVDGMGESTGTRNGDSGMRISSLKFWSDDAKSLIKVGSGIGSMFQTEARFRSLHGMTTNRVLVRLEKRSTDTCSSRSSDGRQHGALTVYVFGSSAKSRQKYPVNGRSFIRWRAVY